MANEILIKNASSLSTDELDTLYNIIIKAYALTEDIMWGKNYIRISKDLFLTYVNANEFLVAFYKNEIAGGLRMHSPEKYIQMFSLFGVDFKFSGLGIGLALMHEVERLSKIKKSRLLSIELLRTRANDLPDKIRIANWYKRFGFKYCGTEKFEVIKPDILQPSVPCDFDYYQKEIKI